MGQFSDFQELLMPLTSAASKTSYKKMLILTIRARISETMAKMRGLSKNLGLRSDLKFLSQNMGQFSDFQKLLFSLYDVLVPKRLTNVPKLGLISIKRTIL